MLHTDAASRKSDDEIAAVCWLRRTLVKRAGRRRCPRTKRNDLARSIDPRSHSTHLKEQFGGGCVAFSITREGRIVQFRPSLLGGGITAISHNGNNSALDIAIDSKRSIYLHNKIICKNQQIQNTGKLTSPQPERKKSAPKKFCNLATFVDQDQIQFAISLIPKEQDSE